MEELISLLNKYKNFQECVLLDMDWRDLGLTIDFKFNYIWRENKRELASSEQECIIRFKLVQELYIVRDLNEVMISNPKEIDWGINEISVIRIEDDDRILDKYQHLSKTFHHAVIYWENKRKIEIVFAEMEIIPRFLTIIK